MSIKLTISILILSILSRSMFCEDVPLSLSTTEGTVINMNEENFNNLISSKSERWFIFFHNGCPDCQAVYPIWHSFVRSQRDIHLGSINVTTYPHIASKYDIKIIPSFVFFDGDVMEIYQGANTVDGWNDFISKKKGSETVNKTGSALMQEDNVIYLNESNFEEFVLMPKTRPWFILFHIHCPKCEAVLPIWSEFARTRKEGPNIGVVDCEKSPDLARKYNIKDYPTFIYFEDGEQQIYDGEKRIKEWSQYVDQKQNKDLALGTPVIDVKNSSTLNQEQTSNTAPTTNTKFGEESLSLEHAAIELTQNNFESLVSSAHDTRWFIMFYAPWCPHCHQALPTWKEFAHVQTNDVKIGLVNCVEHPGLQAKYNIQGFPTFMFFDKMRTEIYYGPRTVDYWNEFITQRPKVSDVTNNQTQTNDQKLQSEDASEKPFKDGDQVSVQASESEILVDKVDEIKTGDTFSERNSTQELPRPVISSPNGLKDIPIGEDATEIGLNSANSSTHPSKTIGDSDALNGILQNSKTPVKTIEYEKVSAGSNEARPGVIVETVALGTDEMKSKRVDNHYREPMLVIGVVAVLLLSSFFIFLCYQQFRGKYSPIDTVDQDTESGDATINKTSPKRISAIY